MDVTRRHWLGFASALALGGAAAVRAAAPEAPTIRTLSRGARDPAALLAALTDFAQAEMVACGLPGLTIGIAGPDNLRATIALGHADLERGLPVRSEQLFQIGSISKSILALCLCRLAEQGKIDLDARAATILPDISWPDPAITVAMLLNHSAGLADDAPAFPRSPDGKLWANYAPGKRFSYSNLGFDLLGMMVARVSGMPYHRAIRTLVLEPLGMTATQPLILTRDRHLYPIGYAPFGSSAFFPDSPLTHGPWLDIEIPAGSVAAPAADMVRYVAYLAELGQGRGAPLLSDAMAKRYITPTIDADEFGRKARYAMGLAVVDIDGRTCLHHTGGMITFHSSITVDPVAGGGVFASTNSGAGDYRPRRITAYGCRLLRAFVAGTPLPAAPKIVAVPPVDKADHYAGRFIAEGGDTITIAAADGDLTLVAGGVSGRLLAIGGGRFATDHPRLTDHEFFFPTDHQDRLWWGGTLYGRDKPLAPPTAAPEIAALAGVYVNDSPWIGGFSLVARGDTLVLEGVGSLTRAEDGSWRAGDALPAERFWFDAHNGGRPERMIFSGVDMRRFHDQDS